MPYMGPYEFLLCIHWPKAMTVYSQGLALQRLQVSPYLSVDCATFHVFRKEKQKHTK